MVRVFLHRKSKATVKKAKNSKRRYYYSFKFRSKHSGLCAYWPIRPLFSGHQYIKIDFFKKTNEKEPLLAPVSLAFLCFLFLMNECFMPHSHLVNVNPSPPLTNPSPIPHLQAPFFQSIIVFGEGLRDFIEKYCCPGKIAYNLYFACLNRHFKNAEVRGAWGGYQL